jgi:hypothetical protein
MVVVLELKYVIGNKTNDAKIQRRKNNSRKFKK